MKILAKSDGTTLEEHIEHLNEQCDQYFLLRPFVSRNKTRTGEDLEVAVRLGVQWHDEGKKHKDWQGACQRDYKLYQAGDKRGTNLQHSGIRHELASLEYIAHGGIPLPETVRIAIAAHHGKLGYRHENRWGEEHPEFEKFWKEFVRLSNGLHPREWDKAILSRYEYAGPRAVLQFADHRASAFEANEQLPDLKTFSYSFPHKTRQGVQRKIEHLWDEPFAVLRAPTGAGKTDAALLWARHQISKGRADRLVIAMPTRFTANALAIATTKDLSATGLYHSSAWFQRLKANPPLAPAERQFVDKEQEMARLLETPVTVTTIDHLCISLTGAREDHHAIFFNMAHSCVVIDEADFYDDFTQQNIVTLLHALHLLCVPVLVMSATVPESAKELYAKSGYSVTKIHEDTSDQDRTRCQIIRRGKAEGPEAIEDILIRALNGEPTIIYANTVKRAQAYYNWLRDRNGKDVVLYHSRFTEPHKARKEEMLYGMLGRDAWKAGTAHGIAVLTQIGELSVNISADLMISDLCPLDRLAQRAGRLLRFSQRGDGKGQVVGELYVVDPCKQGSTSLYPAPYGRWRGGNIGWEMSEPLQRSNDLLQDGKYSAKRFVDLVNEVYPVTLEPGTHVLDNQRMLENMIAYNWLILPRETMREEDDGTKGWKTRDIPLQKTVYADYRMSTFMDDNEQSFSGWRKFREFELVHGIDCYSYEYQKAVDNACMDSATFIIQSYSGDELTKEKVWLVRPQHYDFERGLHFDLDQED